MDPDRPPAGDPAAPHDQPGPAGTSPAPPFAAADTVRVPAAAPGHPGLPGEVPPAPWERPAAAAADAPTAQWAAASPPAAPSPAWSGQDGGWERSAGSSPTLGAGAAAAQGWGTPRGDDTLALGAPVAPGDPAGRLVDDPRGRQRRPASLLTTAIVSALIAAIVSAAITLGITSSADGGGAVRPAAQQVADRADDGGAQPPAGTPLPDGASVGEIAEAALPSVALVQVAGQQGEGSGSAVVYSEDGYLITNNHVVEGAQDVRVQLPDAGTVDAEVVGTDPLSDLAVLRVEDAPGLVPLPFADSAPAVGDTAIAIGSPFSLESTVTQGIISATGRNLRVPGENVLPDVLQTDAAINPGNSGGALLNARGQLIGINTAILSESGTNSGVGFAIPVTTVAAVVPQLIEDGAVQYAYLGVSSQDAATLGVQPEDGAVIARIESGTPAEQAGLQEGDVVVAIDGEVVTGSGDLTGGIRGYQPGDTVTLDVVRDGDRRQVQVTLGTRPRQ